MSENKRLSERNAKIAAMLSDGEQLKNFYRFIAQNPYINLHDACQIVIERPDATVCNSMEEWNALGRRVTKGRKAISYYDHDGYKQFVFDAADTHGEERYQRPIFPLRRMLIGLDELNGTSLYDDLRGDYRKIHNGVYTYLEKSGALTGDEQHVTFFRKAWRFRSIARRASRKQQAFICADFRTRTEKTRTLSKRCTYSRNFLQRRSTRHTRVNYRKSKS